jgi:hypothetical protein
MLRAVETRWRRMTCMAFSALSVPNVLVSRDYRSSEESLPKVATPRSMIRLLSKIPTVVSAPFLSCALTVKQLHPGLCVLQLYPSPGIFSFSVFLPDNPVSTPPLCPEKNLIIGLIKLFLRKVYRKRPQHIVFFMPSLLSRTQS